MMDWTEEMVGLRHVDGSTEMVRAKVYGPLAVHLGGQGWIITHVPTGFQVARFFRGAEEATTAAEKLVEALTPAWWGDIGPAGVSIMGRNKAHQKIGRVVAALGGEIAPVEGG